MLGLMAEGWSNTAIAGRLHLSISAVEKRVTAVFAKLGLQRTPDGNRRVLATRCYLEGPVISARQAVR